MRPLRTRLLEARGRLGLPWEVLERDYILSWLLAGIAEVKPLRETLVFKGGTALKKCYFGDYRFSVDLAFSSREGVPRGDAMETVDEEILKPGPARRIIHEHGEPLEAEIPVYALEEIVAEKLRAILFQGGMLRHVERTWTQWLGPLVPELPPFPQVMSGLRLMIAGLVPTER